jgi:hypothetical protein
MGWIHRDIEGSILLLDMIVNNKFLTGSNKRRKQHASYEKRNQGLLHESISSSNHLQLGNFARSWLPG